MENNQDHVHSFENIVVPPTCQERGYTLHRCACGYEHKDRFTHLGDHQFALVSQQVPTCLDPGNQTFRCTVCGKETTKTPPAQGHNWSSWNVVQFATCTDDGLRTRKCSRCGEKQEQVIPTTGHKCSRGRKNEEGQLEYYCLNCGMPIKKPVKPAKEKKTLTKKQKLIAMIAAALAAVAVMVCAVLYLPSVYHYYAAQHHIKEEAYSEAYHHLLKSRKLEGSKELLKDFVLLYENTTKRSTYFDSQGNIELENTSNSFSAKYTDTGDPTEIIYYDADGNITEKRFYSYNQDGNETLYVRYVRYNAEDVLIYKRITEYDRNGYKILDAVYEGEDLALSYKHTYENDKHGNPVVKNTFSTEEKSRVYKRYAYTYDADGNMIQRVNYDYDYDILSKEIFKYDDGGNLIRHTRYQASTGNLTSVFEYNARGLQTLYETYSEGVLESRDIWQYDDKDNLLVEASYGADGVLNSKAVYTYNKDGHCIGMVDYSNGGRLIGTYEYKVDQEGNILHTIYTNEAGDVTQWDSGKFTYDRYGIMLKGTYYDEYGRITETVERSADYNTVETISFFYSKDDSGEDYVYKKNVTTETGLVITYQPKESK